MHLTFVSIGAHGHVNPTLSVVEELVQRGHRISYATNEKFRGAVESAGAAFIGLPSEMPSRRPGFDPAEAAEMMRQFLQSARQDHAVFEANVEADRPDAICYNAMTVVGRYVAERLGLPEIALHPTYASNEQFSMRAHLMSAGSGQFPAEYRELFAEMQQMWADLADDLGVRPASPFDGTPAPLNIVFLPREFQLGADTFDDRFRFVGPSLGSREDNGWRPPGRPLLFASLGTTFSNNQPEFFRTCLQAFGDSSWRVAMAVGEDVDTAALGPLPGNVEVRPFFPQPAVLRHTDVFVSHAGMNSTMESLYFGVPIVAVPQQPEQEANARQVDQLGLGRHLAGADLTADLLRHTVDEVHADQTIRANLTEMSKALHAGNGAIAAADAIEAHMAR